MVKDSGDRVIVGEVNVTFRRRLPGGRFELLTLRARNVDMTAVFAMQNGDCPDEWISNAQFDAMQKVEELEVVARSIQPAD
jgi:hypothetical protein